MRARWFSIVLMVLFIGLSVVMAQDAGGDLPAPGLVVTDIFPADGSQYASDQPIVVVFNRPIVPLITSVSDPAALIDPLIIEPALTGRGEWINSSIYQFIPDAFASGTTYRLTVDPALTSLDGLPLSAPFSATFTTGFPRIIRFQPSIEQSQRALPDDPIRITFDGPVDRASAEASLSVRANGQPVAGSITWDERSTTLTFTPAERYPFGATVTVEAGKNVSSAGGGTGAPEGGEWTFEVVPLPAVVSSYPRDGEQEAYPYGGITIYFASPMRINTLRDRVRIEPEPWREGDAYYSEWDYSYTVAFPTEPGTDYTITLLPGMEDIYGNAIAETTVIRYRTRNYNPDVSVSAPAVGYFNAYNPRTQVFLTRRNVPSVDVGLYTVPIYTFLNTLRAGNPAYSSDAQRALAAGWQLLNRWQVTSAAPENVLRYDLLDLGQAAYHLETFCPGAPDARLTAGMEAVVTAGDEGLRLRASAPAGEISALLDDGTTLTVLSDAVCAGGYRWYQVQTVDGLTGWVAEGDLTAYYLEPVAPLDAPLTPAAPLEPGIYALSADPGLPNYMPDVSVMVVATLNVTLKLAPDELLAWVTDMQTGLPVGGVMLDVYRNRSHIGQMVSDASGLARIAIERPSNRRVYMSYTAIARAEGQFGVGWSDWTDGISGWEFGVFTEQSPFSYAVYLYSDRPIYRPGQPVYFRGIARANDDLTYAPYANGDLRVQIFDPDDNVVFDQVMRTSAFGSFEGTFDIPSGAMLGTYRLSALTPDLQANETWVHSYTFAVQEYRAPEFEVTVTPERSEVAAGDTIRALVNARYFFGGSVSGGTVEYTVINAPYSFDPDVPGYWSWGDADPDAGASEFYYFGGGEIASGTGALDAEGNFLIELPADLEDATQSQRFTIEVTVSDESGQAVAGRAGVVVHKGDRYVGIQPESYVGRATDETTVNLIAVGWDGTPIPDQRIVVEVVERRWYSVQEQDENGRTTWMYDVEEIPVTSETVTTGSDGRASFAFVPPNGGIFKIRAVTLDSAGRTVISAATIWVMGGEYIPWRQQNSNRIDLIVSEPDYAVGETAEILITSPFQGEATALITVERGAVLYTDVIALTTNSYLYQLPITEEMIPVAYVSVIIVKGSGEAEAGAIAYPQFRMGLTQLNINNRERTLTIELTPDISSQGASPGDTVVWTIRTTDAAGQPVSAEVGLGLTDQAVLSISPRTEPSIVDYFYGTRPLNVVTSTGLTANIDQITQEVLDTIKGGGGGFGEGGIFDIREEFIDTPFWAAQIVTDANGLAEVTTTLPDNLTTWVMDARAITRGGADGPTLVGQTTYELLSTLPVLIRPVTPRFFVAGDQVTLAAIINNNTGDTYEAVAALEATGVTFADGVSAEQTVLIPAGGRVRVEWPVVVVDDLDVTSADLTFYVSAANGLYNDASKPLLGQGDGRLLPIYRYSAPETIGTAGVLNQADTLTEIVSLPTDLPITEARVDLNLSFSLAEVILDALDAFDVDEDDFIETTISRTLPNIITYNALRQLGVADQPRFARLTRSLNREVQTALARIYSTQNADGGWGWMPGNTSDPVLTAYALIALAEARDGGYAVTERVISGAVRYLQGQLVAVSAETLTWRLNRQAILLYALARANAPVGSALNNLFELRERLSFEARGFLLKAFAHASGTSAPQAIALRDDLIASATLTATGAFWDDGPDFYNWCTDTRASAVILSALIDVYATGGLTPNVVRWLVSVRAGDRWETRQETAWAVMALADWLAVTGELDAEYPYSASVGGATVLDGAVTPETVGQPVSARVDLPLGETPITVTRGEGNGSLYYTAHVTALLPVPAIEPLDNGIILQRRYTLPDDPTAVVTSARVGDSITARLTIIAPTDLYYVVVTDPIPAGTDAINPDLATAPQVGTRPELERIDPERQGWGWWWWSRIEFRDRAVVLSAEYLPAGTYEFVYTIRAGLPGVYNVIPPTGQMIYFPEIYGRGAGSTFTIAPGEGA